MMVLALVVALTGCDDQQKKQSALLNEENARLRSELEDKNKALDAEMQRARDEQIARAEAERKLAEMQAGGGGMTGGNSGGALPVIEGADVTRQGNTVMVSVSGDVLFDSGRATLKASAKKTLDSVARVLTSQYSGMSVRIEGHTDTDPIRKSKFKSNYELGLARANTVADYLTSKGVPASVVSVASAGDSRPKATKAASRRVEISVLTQ